MLLCQSSADWTFTEDGKYLTNLVSCQDETMCIPQIVDDLCLAPTRR